MITNSKLKALSISSEDSLYRAIEIIDKSGSDGTKLALVINKKNQLIGIINDGDIRRALLNYASLDSSVKEYMKKEFIYVDEGVGRAAVLEKMTALGISQIPVLNKNKEVISLHLLGELITAKPLDVTAVIMAGGKGTRLRPITENLPKPMIRVAGRPILEHIIYHLVGHGVKKVFVSVNYMAHMVENYFGDGSKFGCNIEYLREDKPLGTAGALSLLPKNCNDILLMNGDLITQFDVRNILELHHKREHTMTIGVRDYITKIPYGVIEEKDGEVIAITEKPTSHCLINGGVYVISPQALKLVPKDVMFFATDLIDACFTKKLKVGSHLLEEDWVDVGEHEQLKVAKGD